MNFINENSSIHGISTKVHGNVPNLSLFIPAIDFKITKNMLKEAMENTIGKVSRVDFVSFNSDKGTGRRAFIHFSEWYDNHYPAHIQLSIMDTGFCDVVFYNTVMRLMVNKNPVPETEQTLPQVAANIDFMAEKIRIQEQKIEDQQNEINGLKQLFENMYHELQLLKNK
jgi:hypothetical protein